MHTVVSYHDNSASDIPLPVTDEKHPNSFLLLINTEEVHIHGSAHLIADISTSVAYLLCSRPHEQRAVVSVFLFFLQIYVQQAA